MLSALLCGAEGVEMSLGALCVFELECVLWKKDDPAKRWIKVFVGLDAIGTDVKTSGCSNEETTPSDEYVKMGRWRIWSHLDVGPFGRVCETPRTRFQHDGLVELRGRLRE